MNTNRSLSPSWPILTRYDQKHLRRIALPLGGIGTGTVSLGGRGDLRDWEIVNRPAKGFYPPNADTIGAFFALYAKPPGGPAVVRALEGPIDEADYEGLRGAMIPNHGLPKFRHCEFAAAYPLGQVLLADPDMPLAVRLEAFNPLIPGDSDASGIPVAVLRYVLINRTGRRMQAAIAGTVPNFIGADGSNPAGQHWDGKPEFSAQLKGNVNEFRRGQRLHGVFMSSRELDPGAEQWGTMALCVLGLGDAAVSHRTAWAELGWGEPLLDFWRDFSADGRLDPRQQKSARDPRASLCASLSIPPRAERSVTFLFTWYFPNRMTWTPAPVEAQADTPRCEGDSCCGTAAVRNPNWIGNYYTTQYRDAWDVAEKLAPRLPRLEAKTVRFTRALCDSDLPHAVKEAALFNVSTLRTQTTFRTPDGMIFGWEGCHDRSGCCHGSCTHVWNYENAVGFLFGDLARQGRRVEFLHATDERGLMSFRVNLPLARAREAVIAAADGQMGAIMRAYREWKLSGDDAFLREIWPGVRRALEFCWIPGGWDGDQDGVMEGCQHNTMDVEYYGPNAQMGLWYLGALRASEELARRVGEEAFASRCRALFELGRRWIDANLFNGEYYEHQVRPPKSEADIAPGLRVGMGSKNLADPDFQLGPACLVDQLVGQYMAHATGLGYLTSVENVKSALRSVMKYNFRKGFFGHFNSLRSFVLNGESALLMATYPRGINRSPFPYCTEVMTGFEYTAACGMLYEGMIRDGLTCIKAIRDRYDGRKRSPFNEAECGHHYARAMASWTAVLALTGFQYSGVDQSVSFAAKAGTFFWSNGSAWGTCRISKERGGVRVALAVLHGSLSLKRFAIEGIGEARFNAPRRLVEGKSLSLCLGRQEDCRHPVIRLGS
jgi:uncharacterized protein (DUF608 family)